MNNSETFYKLNLFQIFENINDVKTFANNAGKNLKRQHIWWKKIFFFFLQKLLSNLPLQSSDYRKLERKKYTFCCFMILILSAVTENGKH